MTDSVWLLLPAVVASRAFGFACGAATLAFGAGAVRDLWREPNVGAALSLLVRALSAVLFVARRPPRRIALTARAVALTWLSLGHVLLFDVSGPASAGIAGWMGPLLAVVGLVGCLLSTAALGRSYALLPADRGITSAGPYRWLRHPLYASYLLLDESIVFMRPSAWNALVVVVGAVLFMLRIHEEEAVLARAGYAAYARRVPFRLLPHVY